MLLWMQSVHFLLNPVHMRPPVVPYVDTLHTQVRHLR